MQGIKCKHVQYFLSDNFLWDQNDEYEASNQQLQD